MDLSFITQYRVLISDIIQFCAWALVVYKLFTRPETQQNQKIDMILEKLDAIEYSEIAGLKVSIRMLIRRQFARLCYDCIKQGYVTVSDMDNIETLYQEYHVKYGMNGRGEELYHTVLKLPIKDIENE